MRQKIIELIKSKIKLKTKKISLKEAEKIITKFNKPDQDIANAKKTETSTKSKVKSKKISKK